MLNLTIKPEPFYNRKAELAALDRAWRRHGSGGQMMLLYGRRRLGKTFLLQRYFSGGTTGGESARPHIYCLAEQTTATAQRISLAQQVLEALPAAGVTAGELSVSWNTLLRHVSQQSRAQTSGPGRCGFILDELPYLIEQTPELPSILQAWWDRDGVHAPLLLVLCGSQLSAMAALGNESAPLFGRFNAGIVKLEPLLYLDVATFYEDNPNYGIAEKLLMYGVLGGTPRYHAIVDIAKPPAQEIVTLLMQPRAILENEVRFLLGSEQIRDPAPYNAVLGAIASGETQFGHIQQRVGVERGTLSFYLRTLQNLGWIRRDLSFGESSDRRALYRVADPFLAFWYRFIAPLASALQFSEPQLVYEQHVAPYLAQYMGSNVFEDICAQWLRVHAGERLGLTIRSLARYWSRNGNIEIDLVAELDDDSLLFGECKWSANSLVRLNDYAILQAKVAGLPEARWRSRASYILFSIGGFGPELNSLAADPRERLSLVSGADLLADVTAVT